MAANGLGWRRSLALAGFAALTLGVGLGRSGRLTYHEAFVAQAAREMLAAGPGGVLTPTVGGRPWLEKPPMAVWLAAAAGRAAGGVGEASARAPSAAAAGLLALGVAALAARRHGPDVGLLAGLVQLTTLWTVTRGRLAEADMTLACLIAWTLAAFDRLRTTAGGADQPGWRGWRWAFFAGLGATSLSKGVGFGAALVLAAVGLTLAWDRDLGACRRLRDWRGWALAGVIGLGWPALAAWRHPSALGLWVLHVSDRLSDRPEHFAGQGRWAYALGVLGMALPWTPPAILGAWRSLGRAVGDGDGRGRGGDDRLLWAWLAGPLALLSLATVRHAHYATHALPPCSVWAALGLARLAERLRSGRGWSEARVRRLAGLGFAGLGLAYAVGFLALGPRLDRRGVEWAFYEEAARRLRPGEPVALLYQVPEWDREPYATPFGPVPHDWAVRLFYLGRPAPCRFGLGELAAGVSGRSPFAVIGRESDAEGLGRLGRVETLARGPATRWDRTYRLYRVTPGPAPGPVGAGAEAEAVAARDMTPRP